MLEKQEMIRKSFNEDLANVTTTNELNDLKVKYLGKKGLITELTSNMKELSIDERKEVGRVSNELKNELTNSLNVLESELKLKELNEKLASEKIDISLPATKVPVGAPNVLEKVIEEVEELLMSMGYDVVDGPEIEEDKFNFEMLNIPKGHPARDAQDTFYIKDEEILLRSQTSPVQARTMLKGEGKTPIRMICPGKTYRRDDDDATHSHQFMQLEGLVVDKNITMSDLKGTLSLLMKKMFGENRSIRFKPSYFPFTEPSVEVDVSCFKCGGKGCPMCKHTGWIEVLGAGMVHPNVLRDSGYDPKVWRGFAFGIGIERVTMLRHGIDDIRGLYTNDKRLLSQFKGE